MYFPRYLLIVVLVAFASSKSTNFAYEPCQCADGSGKGFLTVDCLFGIGNYICGPGIGALQCCQHRL